MEEAWCFVYPLSPALRYYNCRQCRLGLASQAGLASLVPVLVVVVLHHPADQGNIVVDYYYTVMMMAAPLLNHLAVVAAVKRACLAWEGQ